MGLAANTARGTGCYSQNTEADRPGSRAVFAAKPSTTMIKTYYITFTLTLFTRINSVNHRDGQLSIAESAIFFRVFLAVLVTPTRNKFH